MCQTCEPQYTPSLATDTVTVDEEAIDLRTEPGFGIFDSGATGSAISAFELNNLRAEEPGNFSRLDAESTKGHGLWWRHADILIRHLHPESLNRAYGAQAH